MNNMVTISIKSLKPEIAHTYFVNNEFTGKFGY